MREALRVASCMAENAMPFARAVADYLDRRLGAAVVFVEDIPWQEREQALYRGEIDLCWICGLPYVRRRDSHPDSLEPIAAVVSAGARYGAVPVYFSDVVVAAGSSVRRLEELRGARWCYNEPNSHSGYNILLARLVRTGAQPDFLRRFTQAGSHQEALRQVLEGSVDAAAIDSTVLETEIRCNPATAKRLRVVESLGPSPAPPWVCPASLPRPLRAAIARSMADMHQDAHGSGVLSKACALKFVAANDSDYDPIRRMDEWTLPLPA